MDFDWRTRVKELFLAARGRRPEERSDYLDEACGEDVELRRELESLLIEHDRQAADGNAAARESPAPAEDSLVGSTLGRYRILRLVGKGGMGAVYEAEDPKLRRKVALKVLPEAFAADPKRLERFQREARSVAALSHPNIVTLYSVEAAPSPAGSGDTHFLTMELVRGEPLNRLIPEHGLDLGEILGRATQLADGLRAAHDAGIVHRDLKPANVIVDTEGRIRILDFGLAKIESARPASSQADTSVALTAHGAVLGTAPYMSPEQVAGRPCDHRSDIFSLGSILYEMSTGRRPFSGEGFTQVMSAILQDEVTPVTEVRTDLPEGLERVIGRCLEKDPAKRFQTARELRDALEELKIAQGAARHAAAKWVGLAAAVAVLAVVGVLTLKPGAERPSTDEASESPATEARMMIAVLPFQNLGSSEDEYFALGMTEEIASRMASVRSLGVIATSSTRQYAGTHKTAREIGKELGVGYLVTGSILWAHSEDGSSRIRITPQLISTADETQIWAQSYERALDDIFAIQTEIASQVVSRLGISLGEPERAAVARLPTDNLEAYDAYLRAVARGFDFIGDPAGMESLIEKLYRAVELDPDFALAWFVLANSHSSVYSGGGDISEERRRLALDAARRVEAASPGSALAAAAMGTYQYRVERNYDRALEELDRAVELDPNSTLALWLHGSVLRRKADFEGAVASYQSGMALDPRNRNILVQLGVAYRYLRLYEKAVDTLDRAIAQDRDSIPAHYVKVETLWSWGGHGTAARRALEAFPVQRSPVLADYLWYWQAVYEGDFRAAAERIRMTRGEWLGMKTHLRPRELLAGLASSWSGETALADQQFELAVAKLEAWLVDASDNGQLWSSLGVALAALGRRDEALEAALRATELVPLATDPWFAQSHIEDLAWVYTLLDDYDAALEQLEVLLERPSRITISFLELDPRWAPLRDHPRYRELKDRYGEPSPVAERAAGE